MTTPSDDAVLVLLRELVDRDDARREQLGVLQTAVGEVKAGQARSEVQARDIKTELQRQDQQIQLMEKRVSGNYMGISAQLELFTDELRTGQVLLGNVEKAMVVLNRTSRILHGRFIEESDIVGGRLTALGERLDMTQQDFGARIGTAEHGISALERRLADASPPAIESVVAAGG